MIIELNEGDIKILLPYALEEREELQGYYDLGHSKIKARIDALSEIIDKVEKKLEDKVEKPNTLHGYSPLQRLLHHAWEERKELQGYYDLSHSDIKARIDTLSEIIDKVEKKLSELEE